MEEGSSLRGLTSSLPPPTHQNNSLDSSSLIEIEQSSPTLPTLQLPTQAPTTLRNESFLFSTDPIQAAENLQSTGPTTAALFTRKRTFQGQHSSVEPHKPHRPILGNKSKELVLQARDLIIRASAAASTHTEQTSLLDLLKVFRDYTENNRVKTASTILATQVASLESTTQNIANKTR